ncbi:hypothetical protein BS47DRAFT_426924 [Hydnum rufescens UP504]|uniref:Uncharacterized protein n=1 Tax=Hydnum rufescens UP504 TaxID=1448309 RepID=A0A9P6B654_9AGAM|nr:hypothetical protein BS47DRAFT_426924 [Hydnum rufescens UP504]
MEESDIMRAISGASSAISTTIVSTTEPIRNTAAYKALPETVSDALDNSGSSRHGGYEAKEARCKRRNGSKGWEGRRPRAKEPRRIQS